jgi:molecular chaperone HscB
MSQRNFFDVLGMAPSFHVSKQELEERYLALSRELHPDRHVKATPRERVVALQRTTELNDAYKVLRSDGPRAEYLLRLHGIDVGEEKPASLMSDERTRVDPKLLMEVMELREALGEARVAGDEGKVAELAADVRARSAVAEREVGEGFRAFEAGDGSRLQPIAQALISLRYFRRFLDEVEAHEAEVEARAEVEAGAEAAAGTPTREGER